MNNVEKLAIQKHFSTLVGDLRAKDLLDSLFSDRAITLDDLQRVEHEATDMDQMRRLLALLLEKKAEDMNSAGGIHIDVFRCFLKAVELTRDDITTDLKTEADSLRSQGEVLPDARKELSDFHASGLEVTDSGQALGAQNYVPVAPVCLTPKQLQDLKSQVEAAKGSHGEIYFIGRLFTYDARGVFTGCLRWDVKVAEEATRRTREGKGVANHRETMMEFIKDLCEK